MNVSLRCAAALVLFAGAALRAQEAPPAPAPAAPAVRPGVAIPTPGVLDAAEPDDAPPPEASPPLASASPELVTWLSRNTLLRGVEFRGETRFDPVDVLVQPAAKPDENHLLRVAFTFGTWAHATDVFFRSHYAGPARLAARPDHERLAVVVVSQRPLFEALRREALVRDAWDGAAFYAPQLPAVVVLDPEPVGKHSGISTRVRPLIHAAVHALIDAFADPGKPVPAWLAEGLAERIASHATVFSDELPSLAQFDVESLAALQAACLDREQRIACVRPLSDLCAILALADLDQRTEGLPVPHELPLQGLAQESSLFLGWLDEADGDHPQRATQAVVRSLAGHGGADLLPGAPDALEGDFVGWVQEQIARRLKASSGVFTLKPETTLPEEVRPGVLARPSDLALPGGVAELEHALALEQAGRGDLAGAAARCAQLLAQPDVPAPEVAALEADQRWLAALQDLRHRWLAGHVGKLVEFHEDDAILRTTVVRTEGEQVVVKDKGKERPLPESTLVPGVLAGYLLAPGNVFTGLDDEARAFAWLLAPDAGWKDKTQSRVRKDAGSAAAALLDRRSDYDARLELGRVLANLQGLVTTDLPLAGASEASREAWLSRSKSALAERALPVVAERVPVLRSLCARVLGARFDEAPLRNVTLRAKVEDLGHGRLRATWSFADAAQLEDWVARPYDADDVRDLGPLGSEPQPTGLAIQDGWAIARGSGDWRCKLPLAAPFSVDYDLRYDFTPAEQAVIDRGDDVPDSKLIEAFAIRMCADDYGSGLACLWFGHLQALDKRGGGYEDRGSAFTKMLMNTRYHLRVEHDGQRVRSLVDGQEVASVSALKRTTGALEIWHHTERPIAFRNLVIEGVLDPAAMAPVRQAWVAAQLTALGAGD